jgi:hypothetical protein
MISGPRKTVRYTVARETLGALDRYNPTMDPTEKIDVAANHSVPGRELERLRQDARTPSPFFKFGQRGYLQRS